MEKQILKQIDLKDNKRRKKNKLDSEENLILLNEKIQNDRKITTRKLADEMEISKTSVLKLLNLLGYRKLSSRWIPRNLSRNQRKKRLSCSIKMLKLYSKKRKSFLDGIITGDETWLPFYLPDLK